MKTRLLMLLLLVLCGLITGCATHASNGTTIPTSELTPVGAPGAVPMTGYITIDDVVRMTKANCHPSTIIREIRTTRTVFHLSTDDIVSLKNEGVSEKVINAMIDSERTAYGRRGR